MTDQREPLAALIRERRDKMGFSDSRDAAAWFEERGVTVGPASPVRDPAPLSEPPFGVAMGALEAALRDLACRCRGDTEGHEASDHLTASEREVFEQVRRAERPVPALPAPEPPRVLVDNELKQELDELDSRASYLTMLEPGVLPLVKALLAFGRKAIVREEETPPTDLLQFQRIFGHDPQAAKMYVEAMRDELEDLRAALPAEHAPPDPLISSVSVMALKAALAALGDNPALCLAEDPSSIVHALRAAYAVDFKGGSRPALAGSPTPIQELAEAAQGYLNSQEMVGHTEESRRALRYRLGCLIGPHLVAQKAGSRPPEGT